MEELCERRAAALCYSMPLKACCCPCSTAAALASGGIVTGRRDEGGGDTLMYVRLYRATDTCTHEQSWAAHGSTYGAPTEAFR